MDISCRPLTTQEDFTAFDNLLLYCQQHGISLMTVRTPEKIILRFQDSGEIVAYDELKDYITKRHGEYQTAT